MGKSPEETLLYIEQSGEKVSIKEVTQEEWRELWYASLKEARKHWEDEFTQYSMRYSPVVPGIWVFRWFEPPWGRIEMRVFVRSKSTKERSREG